MINYYNSQNFSLLGKFISAILSFWGLREIYISLKDDAGSFLTIVMSIIFVLVALYIAFVLIVQPLKTGYGIPLSQKSILVENKQIWNINEDYSRTVEVKRVLTFFKTPDPNKDFYETLFGSNSLEYIQTNYTSTTSELCASKNLFGKKSRKIRWKPKEEFPGLGLPFEHSFKYNYPKTNDEPWEKSITIASQMYQTNIDIQINSVHKVKFATVFKAKPYLSYKSFEQIKTQAKKQIGNNSSPPVSISDDRHTITWQHGEIEPGNNFIIYFELEHDASDKQTSKK